MTAQVCEAAFAAATFRDAPGTLISLLQSQGRCSCTAGSFGCSTASTLISESFTPVTCRPVPAGPDQLTLCWPLLVVAVAAVHSFAQSSAALAVSACSQSTVRPPQSSLRMHVARWSARPRTTNALSLSVFVLLFLLLLVSQTGRPQRCRCQTGSSQER